MVKFKATPHLGMPVMGQVFRYYSSHRFVRVTAFQHIGGGIYNVTTVPHGTLRAGVFTPAKRTKPHQYQFQHGRLWPMRLGGPLKAGVFVTC